MSGSRHKIGCCVGWCGAFICDINFGIVQIFLDQEWSGYVYWVKGASFDCLS